MFFSHRFLQHSFKPSKFLQNSDNVKFQDVHINFFGLYTFSVDPQTMVRAVSGPARGEHGPSSVHCNAIGGSVSEPAAWLLASCRLPASRPVLPSVDRAAEPRAQADTSPFVGRHRAEGFEGNDGICRCGAAWPLLVQCSNILLDPKNYRSYT